MKPSDTQFRKVNRIVGGMAIRKQSDPPTIFGTLGMVVRFAGLSHYLTNSHIAGEKETVIVAPPGADHPVVVGRTRRSELNATVDAAIISKGGVPFSPTILGVDTDKFRPYKAETGDSVLCVGASADITEGIVYSVSGGITRSDQVFVNQLLIRSADNSPVTDEGNSGGMVLLPLDDGWMGVVGLVHSISDGMAVASHFYDVQRHLGILV